ncbi:hypothetical protein Y1Q_0005269 [Alligator mississippiensis]|uniref:Uncharacterized protein n=1 Tax=Alligator mississippiensis TaxID=8496 RepID=A0A151MT82_ALLMI|nr:hypothetical protein Y1Q_0005269 [Alligator mississippiensis]
MMRRTSPKEPSSDAAVYFFLTSGDRPIKILVPDTSVSLLPVEMSAQITETASEFFPVSHRKVRYGHQHSSAFV